MLFAAKGKILKIKAGGSCTYTLHPHVSKADQPVNGGGAKSRRTDTEPPSFLYSMSAQSRPPGLSLTTVCRSIRRTIRKERRGRGGRNKGKKNEGSELSPPLRLLFNTATERGRERARLSKRKSDRGWSPLTKYKAVASEQSQYSAVCVCVCVCVCVRVPVQCLVYHRAAN